MSVFTNSIDTQIMMNESEFIHQSDAIFSYIEEKLEEINDDFDCQISGNILSIEHENGEEIIINRHLANQELWIAAKSGGFHFSYHKNQWIATRNNEEFFSVLNSILSQTAQTPTTIPPFQAA